MVYECIWILLRARDFWSCSSDSSSKDPHERSHAMLCQMTTWTSNNITWTNIWTFTFASEFGSLQESMFVLLCDRYSWHMFFDSISVESYGYGHFRSWGLQPGSSHFGSKRFDRGFHLSQRGGAWFLLCHALEAQRFAAHAFRMLGDGIKKTLPKEQSQVPDKKIWACFFSFPCIWMAGWMLFPWPLPPVLIHLGLRKLEEIDWDMPQMSKGQQCLERHLRDREGLGHDYTTQKQTLDQWWNWVCI